ncbi:hypothetical protein LEMA_P045760.1 [Plenodomus lingam JN3]|uniref:RRM domain-containing protein n=1 Tax=Leptosphaeria maculans (strain JN3 / isolate v23.1.3 / race Av1-4-5-6-7-8) TaxID=985895 RepID=E5R4A2_LEPMJ|nr:hypothetical protein LEMA_P045760.1 [Plenodomus lingam JN3]CBX91870.1 hypothetical protein LEMA_P045760.1 [Plenodomus lingam JN3]
MAVEDTKGNKKRKGAPASSPKAKKAKKSSEDTVATKPVKASKGSPAVLTPVETKTTKAKSARKQAADFMDVDVDVDVEVNAAPAPVPEATAQTKAKKGKAAKDAKDTTGKAPALAVTKTEFSTVEEKSKEKTKKTKKGKQAGFGPVDEDEAPAHLTVSKTKSKKYRDGKQVETDEIAAEGATEADEADDDGEVDDQTAALLAGFGSDDDSDDPSEDLNFDEDIAVPKLNAKQRKAIAKAEQAAKSNEPGVIYVGRVPRGFFEKQMKQYFSQFGKVNRLRLSRNKKTGASKHFAFVEFASSEVADIVARTMDNYLLFGHILKCKLLPTDQVHPDLFKGAGQRFKVDPRNKKVGLAMARGAERPEWEKRVAAEKMKRSRTTKMLKDELGYEFTPPSLKSVKDVPKPTSDVEDKVQEQLFKEAPVAEQITTKKGKKGAKATPNTVDEASGTVEAAPESVEPLAGKKNKKDKKRKSDVALEITAEEAVPLQAALKSKKAKKDAKLDVVIEETKPEVTSKPRKAKKVKA